MEKSVSIPGKLPIVHEKGDTLRRSITLCSGGSAVNLVGSTVEVIVSAEKDGTATATLTIGEGLIAVDLALGKFRIFWQTAAQTVGTYWYKVRVTFSDGTIKTYLEDKLTLQ